jgi:hypothetical protein
MNIKQFGKEIITKLLEGKGKSFEILRRQFKGSRIEKIEYTGSGFFIHYSVDPKKERLKRKNIEIGGTCRINNAELIYDITLFIREGVIDFLEGVIFGEGKFPEKIDYYKFKFSKKGMKKSLK